MAITKNEADAAVQTVTAAPKFPVEKLRSKSMALFGVTSSTFDGATYGLKGDYSVDEMKNIINKWKNTKIKTKEAK